MFTNILKNQKEHQAYGYIIRLTVPIIVQNLFNCAVSSTDIIMLSSIGQDAISAVSLATQYSNILSTIFFGLGSGIAMLSAQYWGKQDLETVKKIQGIGLRFIFLCSLVFALSSVFFPRTMMEIYTLESNLVAIGTSYLRIVGLSHLCWAISETYFYTLRSTERVKTCTFINMFTLFTNISLNAVLIYGIFGLPKMGASGVAIATCISRILQLLLCFLVSHKPEGIPLSLHTVFQKNSLLQQDYLRLALPALGNCLLWGIAFSTYSAIMGHINSDVVAANSIVTVVRSFGTVFCNAISSSAGIYIGKDLGSGKLQDAEEDSKRALILMALSSILGGLLIFLVSPLVLKITVLSPRASEYLKTMLYINCFYLFGGAFNGTLINGVFRAGGDSRFSLICDTIDMWFYAVPLGLLSAFVFHFPPMVVYLLLCTDEFVKMPWVWKHYKSKKWLRNITRDFT